MSSRKKLIADLLYCSDKDVNEKTNEQLDYILSPIDRNIYLEACAGSGKTEVLGMKTAYEMGKWTWCNSGLAVLTFTNEAKDTITDRVNKFLGGMAGDRHFIGTISSFIHGYIAQRFGCCLYSASHFPGEDLSFRIVDPQDNINDNQWLKNYAIRNREGWLIPVNQLSLVPNDGKWSIVNQHGRGSSALLDETIEKKHRFWADRFATYDDMNCIALKCLMKNENVRTLLSKRFPVIFIDECQDLSATELMIMSQLIEAGSIVHYVGDLHQSIYEFRQSSPSITKQHIEKYNFQTMNLTNNFRSSQNIVNISRTVGGIREPLRGVSNGAMRKCFYCEYANDSEIVRKFTSFLNKQGISLEKSAVLCRGKGLVDKLSGSNNALVKNKIVYAIVLWLNGDAEAKRKALRIISKLICKWGSYCSTGDYCMPEKLQKTMNQMEWRLLLSSIMEELCLDSEVVNLGSTYGDWYKRNKASVCRTVNRLTNHIDPGFCVKANTIKSARKTTNKIIECESTQRGDGIKIMTIHASKGCTFDAVLLVSSNDKKSKDGYWENWLNVNKEASRICYVACTRPRYLLCWAVGVLSSDEQRKKLENLGLVRLE